MSVEVRVTAVLQKLTGGQKSVRSEGATVGALLENLDTAYPGIKQNVMQDGRLHRFVNIYLNDEDIRYLGQLDLTYLVCEAHGELVLVDQHAAHERVELARLIARQTTSEPAIQKLLFPMTIEATPAQLELVGRMGSLLAQVGYEAEVFGKSTIALKAVPAGIRHGDPAQLLRSLLDEWA